MAAPSMSLVELTPKDRWEIIRSKPDVAGQYVRLGNVALPLTDVLFFTYQAENPVMYFSRQLSFLANCFFRFREFSTFMSETQRLSERIYANGPQDVARYSYLDVAHIAMNLGSQPVFREPLELEFLGPPSAGRNAVMAFFARLATMPLPKDRADFSSSRKADTWLLMTYLYCCMVQSMLKWGPVPVEIYDTDVKNPRMLRPDVALPVGLNVPYPDYLVLSVQCLRMTVSQYAQELKALEELREKTIQAAAPKFGVVLDNAKQTPLPHDSRLVGEVIGRNLTYIYVPSLTPEMTQLYMSAPNLDSAKARQLALVDLVFLRDDPDLAFLMGTEMPSYDSNLDVDPWLSQNEAIAQKIRATSQESVAESWPRQWQMLKRAIFLDYDEVGQKTINLEKMGRLTGKTEKLTQLLLED